MKVAIESPGGWGRLIGPIYGEITLLQEAAMELDYAVERLLDTGWAPAREGDCETTPDGMKFPSVLTVQREFSWAGLELAIKHNLVFNCYRATWAPVGEPLDPSHDADDKHGTVIGACEREAAVYALAQLREAIHEHQLATV